MPIIEVEDTKQFDIPRPDESIMNELPEGDMVIANDTYNNAEESFTELQAYNAYAKRLGDGEEIADRIYDHDYNSDANQYFVVDDEFTMYVGEITTLEILPGVKGASSIPETLSDFTLDLPSLIYTVEGEKDQECICIVDSNRIKAIKATTEPATVHVYNTLNDFEAVAKITVLDSPSGEDFEILV